MKIAILCSSLAPGKDGVGDYCRVLAGELVRLGHNVLLVALNDRSVATDQEEPRDGISALRFGAQLPISLRVVAIRKALNSFGPDWVSLQYVCYGFHPKGLPWRWNGKLGELLPGGKKLHLMFHEIWIGIEKRASLRHRLVGAMQRHLMLRMIKSLRPELLSTSNETYQSIIQRDSAREVYLMPLFSNVPVMPTVNTEQIFRVCREQSIPITADNRGEFTLAGFFGSLHLEWPPEPFLSLWQSAERQRGRRAVLLAVGRLGPGKRLWDRLVGDYPGISFVHFGEQSPELISHFLQTIDFGVATSPAALLGKSSTVATMLDHGLPVVAAWNKWVPRGVKVVAPVSSLIHLNSPTLGSKLVAGLPRGQVRPSLPATAREFVTLLENAVV